MQKRNNPFEKKINIPVENEEKKPIKKEEPKKVEKKVVKVVEIEGPKDKFTSTMDRELRRTVKIICAKRGIMFTQYVEEACREKIRREGEK